LIAMTDEAAAPQQRVRYDVSDETYAVVQRMFSGEEVDIPAHMLAEIERVYGPLDFLKAYMAEFTARFEKEVLGDVENWKPTGILSVPAELETLIGKPPPALRSEPIADRVRRDLVPLVRAAAAEVPLPPDVPPVDPSTISRPHQNGEHCWCRPWLFGSTVMHRDDNVPVSSYGYMLPNSMLTERHAVGCSCVTCGRDPAGTCSY
jgi:hypothetical protein